MTETTAARTARVLRDAAQALEDGDDLMLMDEAAKMVRRSVDTLRYWRKFGGGPPSFRLGRRVVYRRRGVQEWIRQQAEQEAALSGGA